MASETFHLCNLVLSIIVLVASHPWDLVFFNVTHSAANSRVTLVDEFLIRISSITLAWRISHWNASVTLVQRITHSNASITHSFNEFLILMIRTGFARPRREIVTPFCSIAAGDVLSTYSILRSQTFWAGLSRILFLLETLSRWWFGKAPTRSQELSRTGWSLHSTLAASILPVLSGPLGRFLKRSIYDLKNIFSTSSPSILKVTGDIFAVIFHRPSDFTLNLSTLIP